MNGEPRVEVKTLSDLLEMIEGAVASPSEMVNATWRQLVQKIRRFCLTREEWSDLLIRLNDGKEKLQASLRSRPADKMTDGEQGVVVRRHLADELRLVADALCGAAEEIEVKERERAKVGAAGPMLEPIKET